MRELKTVIITSNVHFDSADNRRYPSSIFFDELQIQLNLSANGRESRCYRTRREAEGGLREYLADQSRNGRGEVRFVTVRMPNT